GWASDRPEETEDGVDEDEEEEMQVQELIERRTKDDQHQHQNHESAGTENMMAKARRSLDMHELFSKGFGSIRRGQDIK
ncbi:hypothetical protein FQN49_008467, partial [Arthroderma sp. PD_2]